MVNFLADKHLCPWKAPKMDGETAAEYRTSTKTWSLAAVNVTDLQCWLLGLVTTLWIIMIQASPSEETHEGC